MVPQHRLIIYDDKMYSLLTQLSRIAFRRILKDQTEQTDSNVCSHPFPPHFNTKSRKKPRIISLFLRKNLSSDRETASSSRRKILAPVQAFVIPRTLPRASSRCVSPPRLFAFAILGEQEARGETDAGWKPGYIAEFAGIYMRIARESFQICFLAAL